MNDPTPLTDAEFENLANQPRAYALKNAKVLATVTFLQGELQRTREALKILYEETADYIRINNLGDVHHNQSMKLARAALTPPTGAKP
jgi:hypothetical protein